MLAALDLGSNSFHLLIAERVGSGFRLIERFSEKVQLGEGVATSGRICDAAMARAILCLVRFHEVIARYPVSSCVAIGTKTFRTASNARELLREAHRLGFEVEVVSGEREAALIYCGVSSALPHDGRKRLVIDIGGGSTEFAIGIDDELLLPRSLDLGCVSWRDRFFADGEITKPAFREAVQAAREQVVPARKALTACGWESVFASSGTAKMLSAVLREQRYTDGTITMDGLKRVREDLFVLGFVEALACIPGLKPARQALLAPGLAIMIAIIKELEIDRIAHSRTALREGVLLEMLQRNRS